jgi:uncharacterized membrane protein YphA (DoxX/SURF4 family)
MIENSTQWPIMKKFIFVLLALYTFFYIFPFPLDAFPQLNFIFNPYGRLHDGFVYRVAKNIFHIANAGKLPFTDSGDTTFDYASVLVFFLLSILLAAFLLLIDKERINYEQLRRWLFLYVRYTIAFYLLVYGFDKVFKSHFPFPSLEKLEQPVGQSTPQGLLWAFMGYSSPYSIYLGAIEVLSGFLLLFRRTTAPGAFLTLMIMINVTIINFSYDVPVKLFALHMLIYALFLSAPFFRSSFEFFFLNKQSSLMPVPEPHYPVFILPYKKWIKGIVISAFTLLFMSFSIINMRTDGDDAPKPPLYGIYKIGTFQLSDAAIPDLEGHPGIFNKIIFDRKNTIIISNSDTLYFETYTDTAKQQILFISNDDRSKIFIWNYELKEEQLILRGTKPGAFELRFKQVNLDSLPLIKRKFHWIVEYPYNN